MANRINQADKPFNSYITSTADYLTEGTPTNAVRLHFTIEQSDEWENRRQAWVIIYTKYGDPSKRTKTVTAEKEEQKKDFTQFANTILIGLSINPDMTNDDRGVFNVHERDALTNRGLIEDSPFGQLLPMSGGNMKVRVRTTSDGNRASKHPDADHVEIRYALVAVGQSATVPPPTNPTGPYPPIAAETSATKVPATAADCPNSNISKKAIFVIKVGAEHSGKRIYAFFRWVNASKEENSSPWSLAVQGVVV